jgi:hypothetical protein
MENRTPAHNFESDCTLPLPVTHSFPATSPLTVTHFQSTTAATYKATLTYPDDRVQEWLKGKCEACLKGGEEGTTDVRDLKSGFEVLTAVTMKIACLLGLYCHHHQGPTSP